MTHSVVLRIGVLALCLAGCAASFKLDGYDVAWVDAPVGIEARAGHPYRGTVVYEGRDGRYYRQHQGRWVVYRERPHDLQVHGVVR